MDPPPRFVTILLRFRNFKILFVLFCFNKMQVEEEEVQGEVPLLLLVGGRNSRLRLDGLEFWLIAG